MPRIAPISYKKLIKVFELDGAIFIGQEGDHISLKKEGARRRLVVPIRRDVPVFIIKNNIKTAGMERKRYFELLKKV